MQKHEYLRHLHAVSTGKIYPGFILFSKENIIYTCIKVLHYGPQKTCSNVIQARQTFTNQLWLKFQKSLCKKLNLLPINSGELFTDHFLPIIQSRWYWITVNQIATNLCTCPDSTAVGTCAKFCSNHFNHIWVRAKKGISIKFEWWQ